MHPATFSIVREGGRWTCHQLGASNAGITSLFIFLRTGSGRAGEGWRNLHLSPSMGLEYEHLHERLKFMVIVGISFTIHGCYGYFKC